MFDKLPSQGVACGGVIAPHGGIAVVMDRGDALGVLLFLRQRLRDAALARLTAAPQTVNTDDWRRRVTRAVENYCQHRDDGTGTCACDKIIAEIFGTAAPEAQPEGALPDRCSLCKTPYRGGVTSDDMTCLICWDCITMLSYKRERPAVSEGTLAKDQSVFHWLAGKKPDLEKT